MKPFKYKKQLLALVITTIPTLSYALNSSQTLTYPQYNQKNIKLATRSELINPTSNNNVSVEQSLNNAQSSAQPNSLTPNQVDKQINLTILSKTSASTKPTLPDKSLQVKNPPATNIFKSTYQPHLSTNLAKKTNKWR